MTGNQRDRGRTTLAAESAPTPAQISDAQGVSFLQWALPQLHMRWPGFRQVRRQVLKRIRRRLAEIGVTDLWAYRDYLLENPAEWSRLDCFCRISISRFYRDRDVFNYVRDCLLPRLARVVSSRGQREIRSWSLGCASGEEPYTLAIIWHQALSASYPQMSLKITATDVDAQMLARARSGCYGWSSLKDLPHECVASAFSEIDGQFCIKPRFRALVQLLQQDVRRELPTTDFHLILCRHLAFTYFDPSLQRETLQRISTRLLPGGYLVAAKKEPVPWKGLALAPDNPTLGTYVAPGLPHS